MQLIELTEQDKPAYNNFVAAQESGSFLQSWEWGEWQGALGRQGFRFWVLNDSQQLVASVQLIKMPLPFGKCYLYMPYGPVIDENFKFQISNFKSIFKEFISKFPNAVFIRIEPKFLSSATRYPLLTKTTNIQPGKTLVINLIKSDKQLLNEMHPKTRYNIRLAQKHRVEIKDEFGISVGHGLFVPLEANRSEAAVAAPPKMAWRSLTGFAKEAVDLIVETSKRQSFKGYNAEYYHKLIDCLALREKSSLKLHIYEAIFKNKLLSSAIIIDFGKTRTFLFGGSSDQDKNVMAPYLLHWQAMLDAKANGLSYYDFWGVETSKGEMPGFARFKLGFSGNIREYLGAWDIINNRILYHIYGVFRYIYRLL